MCFVHSWHFTFTIFIDTQNLEASLAGDENDMCRRLGEMSRKLTVVQVNEKVMARKLHLLQEREAGLMKVRVVDLYSVDPSVKA